MQQEDEEAGDVVVRVRVESQVHETVHAAVQPDRRSPPRNSRFPLSYLTQPSSVPPIPSIFSRFGCGAEENSGGAGTTAESEESKQSAHHKT